MSDWVKILVALVAVGGLFIASLPQDILDAFGRSLIAPGVVLLICLLAVVALRIYNGGRDDY